MEESITLFPEKEEGVPLTINGDLSDGEPCMFVKGKYFSVFYCLCYVRSLSIRTRLQIGSLVRIH